MNQIFERAMAEARALSDQRQGEVGEMLLALVAQESSRLRLSAAQIAEVQTRLAEATELVSQQDMQVFFRKLAE